MLFAVDVGNTNTLIGVYDDDKIAASWRLPTRRDSTADEIGIQIVELLKHRNLDPADVDGMIVSCVVPPLLFCYSKLAKLYFDVEAVVVGPGIKTGMPILYDNPKEVGADRIVNAVAAFARHKKAMVIVDFGTATTFDVISAKGEYLGGAIAPGVNISLDALFRMTSKLPRIEFVNPGSAIGKTTVHSMQAGVFYGYVGLVDALIERIKNELPTPSTAIATGGLATLITGESKQIDHVEDDLTLEGLRLLYRMNNN